MLLLKAYVVGVTAEVVLLATVIDVNAILNLFTILLLVVAAVPVLRSRRKDSIIKDLNEALAAKDRREEALELDIEGLQRRARAAEEAGKYLKQEADTWQARYEEQAKYTAKGAVLHLEQMLIEHQAQFAERHLGIMDVLERLARRLDGAAMPSDSPSTMPGHES